MYLYSVPEVALYGGDLPGSQALPHLSLVYIGDIQGADPCIDLDGVSIAHLPQHTAASEHGVATGADDQHALRRPEAAAACVNGLRVRVLQSSTSHCQLHMYTLVTPVHGSQHSSMHSLAVQLRMGAEAPQA